MYIYNLKITVFHELQLQLSITTYQYRLHVQKYVATLSKLLGLAWPLIPENMNFNAPTYKNILDNCVLPTLWQQFGSSVTICTKQGP